MKRKFSLFFGEHNVRANFYHIAATAYLTTIVLWSFSIISDKASFIIGIILFATDWLAEMYDPNPNNPGPWFVTHFHKITDETSATVIKWVLGIFMILIVASLATPMMTHEKPTPILWGEQTNICPS